MDRERWQSYPLASEEDRRFFTRLARAAGEDQFDVTAEGPSGATRVLRVRRRLEVEAPGPDRGSAVVRIEFVGGGPADGERVRENLWALASEFLEAAERRARAGGAKSAKKVSKAKPKPRPRAKVRSKPKARSKPGARQKPKQKPKRKPRR